MGMKKIGSGWEISNLHLTSFRLLTLGGNFTYAIFAGHQLEAIPGNPQIDLIADPGNAGKVEQGDDEPENGKSPGHPAECPEARIHRAARWRYKVHFFNETLWIKRRLRFRQQIDVATILITQTMKPIKFLEYRNTLAAKGTLPVVKNRSLLRCDYMRRHE